MRFLPDPGDGGAAAVTLEELVEDYCSDEHGQGQMFEGLQFKVEPDLDTSSTEVAMDRFLENGVVRDNPRVEGAGMKQLSTRWEEIWRKRNNEWEYKVRLVGRESEASYSIGLLWTSSHSNVVCRGCEPPGVYLNRLQAVGMGTDTWWKLQKQLLGRRQVGQHWVDHFTFALVDKVGFTRCVSTAILLES